MYNYRNFFIIGPTGSGKTTFGEKLSNIINFNFYDSDLEIEKKYNLTIPEIFTKYGEDVFRDYETDILFNLSKLEKAVIAVGAGAVEEEINRKIIKTADKIIYLDIDLEEQFFRLEQNVNKKNRPIISEYSDLKSRLRSLKLKRDNLYKMCVFNDFN